MLEYTQERKKELRDAIESIINESGLSANKFAVECLNFTNGSKLNHVLNSWDKTGVVGVKTWQKVESYINFCRRFKTSYKYVANENIINICKACETAYQLKINYPVIGRCGKGKTTALNLFKNEIEKQNRFKAYYFNAEFCETSKQFIVGLQRAVGCFKIGTIADQILHLRDSLKNEDCLLLIDEISALKACNIVVIKSLMSALKDICGIVLVGTPYFWNALNKGVEKDKHLFRETKDRLYKYPLMLSESTSETDAENILKANGITGEALGIALGKVDYNTDEKKKLKKYCWYNSEQSLRGVEQTIKVMQFVQSTEVVSPFTLNQVI